MLKETNLHKKYLRIEPPKILRSYIKFFFTIEEALLPDYSIHCSLADCCCEMIFCYKSRFHIILPSNETESAFSSAIYGPSNHFSKFYLEDNFSIFGVHFYPHALFKFFSSPAVEMKNQVIDLIMLLGKEGKILEEKIMSAKNNTQRIEIITDFFTQRLYKNPFRHQHIVNFINNLINYQQPCSIQSFVSNLNLSRRQVERLFKEYTGLSPKSFLSLLKFRTAIETYLTKKTSLTELAYNCNYYDQSHFIHDFYRFSGYKPKAYFESINEH